MKLIPTKTLTLLALGLAALPSAAVEVAIHRTGSPLTARQWEVLDIRFSSQAELQQLEDIDLLATFENDSGGRLEVPGFYDGEQTYVARFTPPTAGEWEYVTASSEPSLDGRSGTVRVEKHAEARHGGIVVDPSSPRRFRYEDGSSYYPIAFECDWLFALDAENPDDIPATRRFVDRLAANGFNQVVMNVFAYDVNWPKDKRLKPEHDFGSPSVYPFGGDNATPEHGRLNIEYFQRLDRVIECLDEKGIAAHLMIYVWNKRVNWPDSDSPEDNRYFDYVVKRYQAFPNLVWDISKEALGYGHSDVNYITRRIERLRGLDAYRRLVTVHDYSYCHRFPKQIDFVSVQLWNAELYGVMRKVNSDFPGQPILNIEHGGYEEGPYRVFPGSYTSPEVCLERAYQCVFAGTYPTHYWQGAAWNVIVPDIDSLPEEERPHLDYYRHLRTLVDRYGLGGMKSGDNRCNSGFCLHNGADRFVYYVPKENINLGVRLPKKSRGRKMTGTWFDPFTGQFSEPIEKTVTQWPNFDKPPGDRFAVLIVELKPETSDR